MPRPTRRGEALGAAVSGDHPQPDLGEPQLRARPGHPEVAGEGELQPAAECVAADGRDHRLRGALDPPHHLLPPAGQRERGLRGEVPEFADVGAGDERPPAGPGEHDPEDRRIAALRLESGRKRRQRLPVERVQRLRTVHREERERMAGRGLAALAADAHGEVVETPFAPSPFASMIMAIPCPPPMQAVASP